MKKFIIALALLVSAAPFHAFSVGAVPSSSTIPVPERGMEARHAEKVAAARAHRYDLLMIGDSITHLFEAPELQRVWRQYYAPRNALNLGFSGARTENILWNLTHGQLDNQSPKVVTLLIGTNNADDVHYPSASTPEQIAEGTGAIVMLLRQKLPKTKILLLRIFPRQNVYSNLDGSGRGSVEQRAATVLRAGELTKSLADNQHVFYLDINSLFLRPDGTLDPKLMSDLLHPSPAGARVWAHAMEPLLSKLFGDTPRDDMPVSRWTIEKEGGILWNVVPDEPHRDFVEMDGEQVAVVVRYGVDEKGVFSVNPDIVWPMLRFHPNLTDSHLRQSFGEDTGFDEDGRFSSGLFPTIRLRDGDQYRPLTRRDLEQVRLSGAVALDGHLKGGLGPTWLKFHRTIFPSVDKPAVIDSTVITNEVYEAIELSVDDFEQSSVTSADIGVYGIYRVTRRLQGAGIRKLRRGQSTTVNVVYEAHRAGEPLLALDFPAELNARMERAKAIQSRLILETPDPVLNTAFAFAKLHATESIFRTKRGLMHAPGGGMSYYAAIWANDQAEYASPFFGMLGDASGTESSINAFRLFASYMNPEYRPIPSSIVGEGDNVWRGVGDRGDMAMIAYGAARFALANGDQKVAEQIWPLIEWCLEYSRRKLTADGVVASDSDELEGRFPAGKANLNTSSLYYDALRSAAYLGRSIGKSQAQIDGYLQQAQAVRNAIERHFGARVAGFETYRYYDKAELAGHPRFATYTSRPDVLRSWIATPLTMGIFDRKQGTIDALFSPFLWTPDGLATEAGQVTIWDRSTLYGLRGALAAGATKLGMEHLVDYSNRRLLGEHVPYAFEAYPEGGKAQLAAESALYCRVFTEGLFGIRPTGLRSFKMTPRLPQGWSSVALREIHAFGSEFDLKVSRGSRDRLNVQIHQDSRRDKSYVVDPGATVTVMLASP